MQGLANVIGMHSYLWREKGDFFLFTEASEYVHSVIFRRMKWHVASIGLGKAVLNLAHRKRLLSDASPQWVSLCEQP